MHLNTYFIGNDLPCRSSRFPENFTIDSKHSLKELMVHVGFQTLGDKAFLLHKTRAVWLIVWLDLTDGDDVVPSYNGIIVSKISRIRLVKTPMKQHVRESVKMPDLIETHIHDHTEGKASLRISLLE